MFAVGTYKCVQALSCVAGLCKEIIRCVCVLKSALLVHTQCTAVE